jgi:uncharacterized HhH-GPD family protein
MKGTLYITGDKAADKLLNTDPLALLIGMLLDQQVPMEWAFSAPAKLQARLGGDLDAGKIAAMPVEDVEAAFRERPALHRFPASMARRTHELCRSIVEHYGGDPTRIWKDATSGADLFARLRALPGFGDEKAKIFLALLAKRFKVAPPGWEDAAGPFADPTPRSVADIDSPAALEKVREWKKAMKAKGKSKQDVL